ncbi:hypothetical protein D3C78_1433680 [compost metagenome]
MAFLINDFPGWLHGRKAAHFQYLSGLLVEHADAGSWADADHASQVGLAEHR